jgi:hypothetical protein
MNELKKEQLGIRFIYAGLKTLNNTRAINKEERIHLHLDEVYYLYSKMSDFVEQAITEYRDSIIKEIDDERKRHKRECYEALEKKKPTEEGKDIIKLILKAIDEALTELKSKIKELK